MVSNKLRFRFLDTNVSLNEIYVRHYIYVNLIPICPTFEINKSLHKYIFVVLVSFLLFLFAIFFAIFAISITVSIVHNGFYGTYLH